jgi:hypothetical protein
VYAAATTYSGVVARGHYDLAASVHLFRRGAFDSLLHWVGRLLETRAVRSWWLALKSHEGQAMVALHPAVSPTLHVHRGGMLAAQLGDVGDCLGAAFW